MSAITTAAEMAAYPLGTLSTDTQGDVWVISSNLPTGPWLHGPETGTLPAAHVLKKWGPLTLQWRPDQPTPVKPSVRDITEAIAAALERDDDMDETARAILALLPGRTEAEVKAEAREEVLFAARMAITVVKSDDAAWEKSIDEYRKVGWDGDPGDHERMFWEAGLEAAAAALRGGQ